MCVIMLAFLYSIHFVREYDFCKVKPKTLKWEVESCSTSVDVAYIMARHSGVAALERIIGTTGLNRFNLDMTQLLKVI